MCIVKTMDYVYCEDNGLCVFWRQWIMWTLKTTDYVRCDDNTFCVFDKMCATKQNE